VRGRRYEGGEVREKDPRERRRVRWGGKIETEEKEANEE